MRFTLLLCLLPFCLLAQRETISLNGAWQFRPDPEEKGLTENWAAQPLAGARTVTVPHTWNIDKGLEDYWGRAFYQRTLRVPAEWQGKALHLHFDGVYHDATIWINGKKAGEHLNAGYTSFSVDITDAVQYEADNLLTVTADNSWGTNNLPYERAFDWSNDGGIIRPVELQVSARPSIQYVHVTPIIDDNFRRGVAQVAIRLWEKDRQRAAFTIQIRERATQKIVANTIRELPTDQNGEFYLEFPLPNPKLWHFDRPNRYDITVTAHEGPAETDVYMTSFGFRKIELQDHRLVLNGEPVRLLGVEFTGSCNPAYGSAEPKAFLDSVVASLKNLNVTITRFHWQQDPYLLDQLDEAGILVQEEIPWWQQPGELTPALFQTAQNQLSEMIERDYNHPCIFAWGLSNEVWIKDPSIYQKLSAQARTLDHNNRLVNIVSNHTHERPTVDFSLQGSMPTWNDYWETWIGQPTEKLPAKLEEMKAAFGNRPLLITEAGLCEPVFEGGDPRRIKDMRYHVGEWAKQDYIAGAIYFCLADYRTHMGEDGAGKYRRRVHGLTDMYLRPKPSYDVFRQLASPLEMVKVDKVTKGTARITLRNKNGMPSYTLDGYTVEWVPLKGAPKTMALPTTPPGREVTFELSDVPDGIVQFRVLRPNGWEAFRYIRWF